MVDSGGKAVIHRLIFITRRYLILQGDAIFRFDPPIAPRQVIGIVTARERNGRKQDVRSFPLRLDVVSDAGYEFCPFNSLAGMEGILTLDPPGLEPGTNRL